MCFIFTELNQLSSNARLELYKSQPQSLAEILLYYLSPICPANFYKELFNIVGTITNNNIREKMISLMQDASEARKDDICYAYDDSGSKNVEIINTYKVKPPTNRLGGLYSQDKLDNVLKGMSEEKKLPPMSLTMINDNDFKYEVIDGIHRYYASVKLGNGKLPAFIQ